MIGLNETTTLIIKGLKYPSKTLYMILYEVLESIGH